MRKALALVAASITVVMLAGCAPTSSDSIEAPAAPPTSPSPTAAVQVQETGLEQPSQVFGGDCSSVFPAADLASLLGSGIAFRDIADRDYQNPRSLNVDQLAGLRCSWETPDFSDGLEITLLPTAAFPVRTAEGCTTGQLEFGPHQSCQIEAESNGIRLSGIAWFGSGSAAVNQDKAAELVELFTTSAEAATAVPLPIPATGA